MLGYPMLKVAKNKIRRAKIHPVWHPRRKRKPECIALLPVAMLGSLFDSLGPMMMPPRPGENAQCDKDEEEKQIAKGGNAAELVKRDPRRPLARECHRPRKRILLRSLGNIGGGGLVHFAAARKHLGDQRRDQSQKRRTKKK